jgi:hypothetical protein
MLHPDVEAIEMSGKHPHGGKIGIGNSWLNMFFKRCKILRLHAAFHDAFGVMKNEYNVGPGYCYADTRPRPNMCFMGHISGLGFWIYIFIFHRELYNLIPA